MRGRKRFYPPAAALSGILLILSFPLPGLSFMAWAALVPLIVVSVCSGRREAFMLGCLCGAVWTAGTLHWTRVYHPLAAYPVVLILALYTGLFSLSINAITAKAGRAALFFTAPAAWTAIEYLKTLGYLGFPWNSLGYTQDAVPELLQPAEFTGVLGISFLIVSVNGALAAAFFMRKHTARAAAALALAMLIPLSAFLLGRRAISRYIPPSEGEKLKIAVMQPSIHPEISWGEYGHIITDSLRRLNLEAAPEKPFLTVFPETVISEDLKAAFDGKPLIYNAFRSMARDSGGYILTGAHRRAAGALYNSAYLISPEAEIKQKYDKMKLVPAGEYVPFIRDNRLIDNLLGGAGGYTPGDERTIFEAEGKRFGVLICFEGIFGNHARKFVRDGAGFLVNITNDAWSMSRASHYQHASMSALRSVENRVYTVRAGNTGISKVINPAGRTEKEIPYWKRGHFTHYIYPEALRRTFYTRRGDVFSILISGLFIIMLAWSAAPRKKKSKNLNP